VALLALLYVVRDDEHATLDDAARAGVPGHFVRLSDGVVHYELSGPDSSDVVVLVHGFSVPMYIWDSTAARLVAAGYRVLRFDTYGRGWSDRPDVPYDTALYTRQIDQLLDSLRLTQPVNLVGLSMGGPVVASYALAHPGRVRSVTLMDPAYGAGGAVPFPLNVPVLGRYVFAVSRAPGMPASQYGDFVHPERYPDWADKYRVQMRYRGFRRAILSSIRANAAMDDREMYRRYGALGIPTLLVWGRMDETVPFAVSDSLRTRIPGVEFVPVDSAAHLPQIEQPAVTHAALLGFLALHARHGSATATPPGT
jgi:pimeloyl-ACP methyl ester carboxylesterase